jgi:hypothetical protein
VLSTVDGLARGRRWVLLQADVCGSCAAGRTCAPTPVAAPTRPAVFARWRWGRSGSWPRYLAVDRLAGGLRAVARSRAATHARWSDAELQGRSTSRAIARLVLWWRATAWCGRRARLCTCCSCSACSGPVYRPPPGPPMSLRRDTRRLADGPDPDHAPARLIRGRTWSPTGADRPVRLAGCAASHVP